MSSRQFRRAREREIEKRTRKRAAKLSAAAGAGLGATVLFAPAADAATFTVTNLNNDGPGSLRVAVETANTTDGDDVVAFQAGLTGTIELADDGGVTGPDIEINYDGLDIQGPGAGVITVDANGTRSHLLRHRLRQPGSPCGSPARCSPG